MTHDVQNADPPEDGPLETAVLFVDLVSSSEFASVLGLKEYAQYVDSFEQMCREQCRFFFEEFHKSKNWQAGRDYEVQFVGDELVVFLHTDKPHNDVYQLIALAAALKCGWLGTDVNARRVASGAPSAELAAGINLGAVWARRSEAGGYKKRGYSINVAKRIESASRDGQHFRIYVSDTAMKRVNRRIRNVLFSPRKIVQMKGVVVPIGVYEVVDNFLDPALRLAPAQMEKFRNVALQAISANSYDLWIHSSLQVSEESRNGHKVTDENLEMCRRTLNIDPRNACALHHAAQGMRERNEHETARLYLEDLTSAWPGFADGWLELGRVLKKLNDTEGARRAILQARRSGVAAEEEAL